MDTALHILLIDDNPDDRKLVQRELDKELPLTRYTEILDQRQFEAALKENDFDLVITDYQLRWSTGIEILKAVKSRDPERPVIMYTGTGSEEIAVQAMKLGLDDYILKGVQRLLRLPVVVKAILKPKQEARLRAEIQQALDQKTEELDSYFNYALDLFCIANTEGFFVRLNREWERTLGYKLEDLEGRRFLDFVHPEDIPATLKALADLEGQKEVLNFTNRYRRKDGSYRWIEWRSAPAGKLIYAAARDITERINSARRLEQALEDAQQGEKVKTLFLANMSHEVRTPLNTLLGYCELLETRLPKTLDREVRNFFTVIQASGERIIKTIHNIIDMAQIEAGTLTVRPVPCRLGQLVRLTVNEFEAAARDKGLTLTCTLENSHHPSLLDEYTVGQALANILENAIKYTDSGAVSVKLAYRNSLPVLTIRDTGIGISEEYRPRLFTPFSQESEGYTKKYQGLGLGLALARGYLALNRVRIDLRTKKGKGSTFTLTFPVPGGEKTG